jgi:4-hydroxybenzoate polyprenyltransferase
LRLKKSLLFSRLAICCGPSFSFAGGWVLHHSLEEIPREISILFVAQGLHLLLKDLPDAEGDRKLGIRTLFTGTTRETAGILLRLIWCVPYVFSSAGALWGIWSSRYHVLWILYPVGLLVIRSAVRAVTSDERELTREFAQVYSTFFVFLHLVLYAPTPSTLSLCLFSLLYYFTVVALRVDRRQQSHGLAALFGFAVRSTTSAGTAEGPYGRVKGSR